MPTFITLAFLLGLLLGATILWLIVRARAPEFPSGREEVMEAKMDQLMKEFEERDTMTNSDVRELLDVSEATATRYLDMLEEAEQIRQVGTTGRSVYYEKNEPAVRTRP
jgi:predicted HTH transcriptional regulator